MINGFDILKEENGESILVRNFEDAVRVAEIIYFNDSHIEIPGIVVFTKEKKGLMFQLMNPGVDIFQVSDEDFRAMTEYLEIQECGVIFFKTKTTPVSEVRVSLENIKERLILARISENTLVLNQTLFTTNEFEYQGSGMFSGRKNVFFVSEEVFKDIKSYIF